MPSGTNHAVQPPQSNSASPSSARRSSIKKIHSPRNIDQVVLGDIAFDTWYFSEYPEELLLPSDVPKAHVNGDLPNGSSLDPSYGGPAAGKPVCSRLYVCPYCFCYSPMVADYIVHLRRHQQLEKEDPQTPPVPKSAVKVYEHDGYAIWEVSGDKEKLYCQNLSLFGKLFLEQKSVFFDTGAFWYYILTYTSPEHLEKEPKTKKVRKNGISKANDQLHLRTQVLGFFSKEEPSWDDNNLACILVFPPFQHRQLGKLLMGVSYKLSSWEWEADGGETYPIGGPEKPLSEMGKKSYLRFWSERIARFILGESADADGRRVFEKKRKRTTFSKEEVTITEIGNRTGMLPEDVVAALTEMGVCEMVVRRKKKISGEMKDVVGGGEADEQAPLTLSIKRSRILNWAVENRIDLEDPVREEGFLGEWAASDPNDSDLQMPGSHNPSDDDG